MRNRYSIAFLPLILILASCDAPPASKATALPANERLTGSPASAEQPTPAKPKPPAAPPVVVEPSQGRPVILRPGDRFYFLMQLTAGLDDSALVTLVHALTPNVFVPIALAEPLVVEPGKHASMILSIPPDTRPGLYDLRVRTASGTAMVRRCVSVVAAFKTRFRFVHLSDFHIGDPTAPAFDPQLIEEINLITPEFVIATGDFVDPAIAGGGAAAWRQTLDYLGQLHAPVFIACGGIDDPMRFAPTVASSPIGSFNYGSYHGVILLNTPNQPIDAGQIEFVRRDLAENRDATFNIIVSNDDDPRVLESLAQADPLAAFLDQHKVRLLLCGGVSDWDGREYDTILSRMPGLHYIRTHAASSIRQGQASGIPHYRVIDVDSDQLRYVYPTDEPDGQRQASVPVGRLGVITEADDPDAATNVTIQVHNSLNQAFADCRLWLRMKRQGDQRPTVAGGRLMQLLDARDAWLCQVSVDVPDRGGLIVKASLGSAPAPDLPVRVKITTPPLAHLSPAETDAGLGYYTCDDRILVRLENRSAETLSLRPVVRLLGTVLPMAEDVKVEWPIQLTVNESIELPFSLLLPDVVDGPHYVQVSFLDDPLRRLYMQRITLDRQAAPTSAPTVSMR